MIASFSLPESERHLYFLLNNTFHLCSPLSSSSYKIAGIYSIHHEGKCRYVGQSQNLPSRIANHLSGAYSYADEFRVYFVCEDGFGDFYERSKESRKEILETNELKIIQILKPIDNIVSDYDADIPEHRLFTYIEGGLEGLIGLKEDFTLTITDDIYQGILMVDERMLAAYDAYNDHVKELSNG